MHKILFAAVLAGLSQAALAGVVYQVDLHHANRRIVSFEVAARGTDRFHPVPIQIDPRDPDGKVTVTLRKGDGHCVRDLRVGFADGQRVVRRDFDLCKLSGVRAGDSLLLAALP
ncbi:MAG: hypothetical protein JSS16_07020 [Proteobacteria bacterium]|nr:hypothetical protein [Pseudomonadota bacterium]